MAEDNDAVIHPAIMVTKLLAQKTVGCLSQRERSKVLPKSIAGCVNFRFAWFHGL